MSSLFFSFITHIVMIFSRYQNSLNSMVLSEDNVRKVVQNRVCSVAIHPSESLVFVAAGDKYGQIGLWNVVSPLCSSPGRSVCGRMGADGAQAGVSFSWLAKVFCTHFLQITPGCLLISGSLELLKRSGPSQALV